MKIRWLVEIIVAGLLTPFIFVSEVHKYLILKLGLCNSIENEVCFNENTFYLLLIWIGICLVSILSIELFFHLSEKRKRDNVFDSKEYDSTPYLSSIAVTNKSYPIVENCSVQLVQVRVLNNQGCQVYYDEKRDVEKVPKFFLWDREKPTKNLTKTISEKIEIALITKDEQVVLLTRKPIDYLPIFPDRKRNESAKKAKYQIEIKISGRVNSDGKEEIVENTSFWEIGYKTDGKHYNSQNIWIREINKLKNVNSLTLGKPIPSVKKFNLVMEGYLKKSDET